jgi:hypothetical protein
MLYSLTIGIIEQIKGYLGFGLKDRILRHSSFQHSQRVITPLLRQIEACGEREGQVSFRIMAIDCDLTVAHLAQCARVLTSHTYRVAALFCKPCVIEDQTAIAFGLHSETGFDPLRIEVIVIPDHSGTAVEPEHKDCHVTHHSNQGDFKYWGRIGGQITALTRRWAFILRGVKDHPACDFDRSFYLAHYAH